MLILYYHELMEKIEEQEGKKYLINDEYGILYKADPDSDPYFHKGWILNR